MSRRRYVPKRKNSMFYGFWIKDTEEKQMELRNIQRVKSRGGSHGLDKHEKQNKLSKGESLHLADTTVSIIRSKVIDST